MTYPAPMMAPYDEWFNEPIVTETQMEYDRLYAVKEDEDVVLGMEPETKEPENIHQLMYEIATASQATTVQLDPPTAPAGWMSGTGWQSGAGLL